MTTNFKMRLFLVSLGACALTLATGGQGAPKSRMTLSEIMTLSFKKAGAGTSGVSGIQTRILKGDPTRPGLYTIQLTVPAHTTIQAHDHPDDRVATVISGTWSLGYGPKFDAKALKSLPPGSFYTEPPHQPHFAQTGNQPAVVQITGYAPTGTKYIHP